MTGTVYLEKCSFSISIHELAYLVRALLYDLSI